MTWDISKIKAQKQLASQAADPTVDAVPPGTLPEPVPVQQRQAALFELFADLPPTPTWEEREYRAGLGLIGAEEWDYARRLMTRGIDDIEDDEGTA